MARVILHCDMTIAEEKKEMRRRIRTQERELSPRYKEQSAAAIAALVCALPDYQDADTVFCFMGTAREIDTRAILNDALTRGKRLCLPLCTAEPGIMGNRSAPTVPTTATATAVHRPENFLLRDSAEMPALQASRKVVVTVESTRITSAAAPRPASSMMAQAPEEMEEIAAISCATVLNTGTPDGEKFTACRLSGGFAVKNQPVVLDPVGVGASAWLWRLVAPRGYNNPSISGDSPLAAEGVGSYWPFATGLRVRQANLLMEQILRCTSTRYVLIPNQNIGIYKVGFTPEWISREYLARRGGVNMRMDRLVPALCPILGYCLKDMKVDGQHIPPKFLRPELQELLGKEGYEVGAKILTDFFAKELKVYDQPELHPVGRQILDCFASGGNVEDYCGIIPLGLE